MSSRSLLLPIETLNREFDGKLLLALHAAQRGWDVIIGQKTALHRRIGRFPPSVYLAKGFRQGRERDFRMISGIGHTIVGLDEEGLVNVSDEMWLARSDSDALCFVAMIVAWGADDARLYKLAKGLGNTPVIPSGNPRVDLLRPELTAYFAPEAERIRERYGRFALLNTNFALVNRQVELPPPLEWASWVSEEKAEAMKSGWLGHKARLLETFLELLPALAGAVSPHALVIRPHPSENAGTWREAAHGLENVRVVHEGNVVPWLAAADVLVHNGCTTAVEASIIGTPALSYRPVKQPGFDNDLPNGVSEQFEDSAGLAARAAELVGEERTDAALDSDRAALLRRHVSALDGPLACSRLLDEIERHLDTRERPGAVRYLAAHARLLKRRARRNVRKPSASAERKSTLLKHQFPPTPVDEVRARLARLDAALGHLAPVETREIAPDLFRIGLRSA